jgi:hypothetical protein
MNSRRELAQHVEVDRRAVHGRARREPGLQLLIQSGGEPAAESGQEQQAGVDPGVVGLQLGAELMANSISQATQVAIRGIVDRHQFQRLELGIDLRSRDIEERPDEGAPARSHRGQAFEPGATEQTDQDRFDLVVTMMGGGDVAAAAGSTATLQKVVADPASPIFESSIDLRPRLRLGLADLDRGPDHRCDALRFESPLSRTRIEVVIEVGGDDLTAPFRAQRHRCVE